MLKRAYVGAVRLSRVAAARIGLLAALERRSDNRAALWLRSLFAIYDIEDMAHLDLPWWTLAAVHEANKFLALRPQSRVFEYGSGASTIWLARRAASVVSIEHDKGWHAVVSRSLSVFSNAVVKLIEPDHEPQTDYLSKKPGYEGRSFKDYVTAIEEASGEFDLIIIDGRARSACLAHARKRLAPGGIILFDNSNRRRYRSAIEASGLSARKLSGMTACLPYPDETSILWME